MLCSLTFFVFDHASVFFFKLCCKIFILFYTVNAQSVTALTAIMLLKFDCSSQDWMKAAVWLVLYMQMIHLGSLMNSTHQPRMLLHTRSILTVNPSLWLDGDSQTGEWRSGHSWRKRELHIIQENAKVSAVRKDINNVKIPCLSYLTFAISAQWCTLHKTKHAHYWKPDKSGLRSSAVSFSQEMDIIIT